MRDNFNTYQSLLVTATAVRQADENFQDHILKADTAPSFEFTAVGSERTPSVHSKKRLPLKMVISEMASRDRDTVKTESELEHKTVSPHKDDKPLHTFLAKKRDPSRCFPEKSFVDLGEDAFSQSDHALFSRISEDNNKESASLQCQSTILEGSQSEKGDESCSKHADTKKVFPHEYYSTPCAKSRFKSLYGNEVLDNIVTPNELPYLKKYKDRTAISDYQSPSSAVLGNSEDTSDNINQKPYSLLHSLSNAASPVRLKCVHESINEDNSLASPSSSSSSTYSSINVCSGWSTEYEHDEPQILHEQINYKCNPDSDYTSENSFLHPLVKFKSKHWKEQNAETNLLYTAKTRNMSDWKPECEHTVSDLKCINSNNNQRYSVQKMSSIYAESYSDTLHDEAASSADLTSWHRLKYTRRTQTITISTKPSGCPQSALKEQMLSVVQPVISDIQCSPSDVNSLFKNKVRILYFLTVYTCRLTTLSI
ncbi:hypothetical protein B7P43_G15025 [Cryptotermes secundus]|uniref:Uncharacterized protein n=1 Tax=Cryptotermes secundus TaxID=105785 RepID=A0A2J7QP12_9NEOP|nr:hypothetical protein B7P43_G15025 [Cryptotermes secundus]